MKKIIIIIRSREMCVCVFGVGKCMICYDTCVCVCKGMKIF